MKRYAVFGAGNIGFGIIEKLAFNSEVYVFDVKKPDYLTSLLTTNANVSFTEINALDENTLESVTSSYKQPFDGLILTVGVSAPKTAFEDFGAFRRTVNINFLGNIVPIRVFLRNRLLKTPAKIIVIASTSGHFAGVSPSAYAPSKWMLVNACQSIRAELEEQEITLDLINPRTIKNVRSNEFKSDIGIDVSTVVNTAISTLAGGGVLKKLLHPSKIQFFPYNRAA